jgi:hypothetical protein
VNTRLPSIFVKYNTKITTSALQNEIPDYEDALDLAAIEQIWCSQNYPLTLTPFSEVTTRLFYNLDLATSATIIWSWIDSESCGITLVTDEYTILYV